MLTTFEIYRRAEKCFEKCLPAEWIPTKPRDDIGVDYWVQITKQGSPTPLNFFVQVKGTTNPRKSNESLFFSVSTEKLKQYMETPLPVLFVLCSIGSDEESDMAYYCWVREAVRDSILSRRNSDDPSFFQKTFSLTIPLSQVLSLEVFKKSIQPTIEVFALRHVRQENDHLETMAKARSAVADVLTPEVARKYGLDIGDPKTITALNLMTEGVLMQIRGRHLEAISYFQAAERILPYFETFIKESLGWESAGHLDEAIKACERGIVAHPKNPYLLSQMGTFLFRRGQLVEAFNLHLQAAEAEPRDGRLWAEAGATAEYIASTLNGGEERIALEKSAQLYERAVMFVPNDDFILADFGLVYSKLYRFPKAAGILEKAVALNSKNVTARRRLASAYLSLRRYQDALEQIAAITALGARDHEIDNLERLIIDNMDGPRKDSWAQIQKCMKELKFGETPHENGDSK